MITLSTFLLHIVVIHSIYHNQEMVTLFLGSHIGVQENLGVETLTVQTIVKPLFSQVVQHMEDTYGVTVIPLK